MIPRISSLFKVAEGSSIYNSKELLPLWRKPSKSALLALSALADGRPVSTKDNREISITYPADTSLAVVRIKSRSSTPNSQSGAEIMPFPLHFEGDKANIAELLKIFDESSIPGLSVKIFRLAELGRQIRHLHPFTFLYIVLTDPVLKSRMRRIYDITIKRLGMMNRNFMSEGFGNKLDRELKRGILEPYIEPFADSLHLPPDAIRPLIRKAAWFDLCYFLLEKTS